MEFIEGNFKPGTKWQHHNGIVYTLMFVANVGHVNDKYPPTVVYKGENGNYWTKELSNFVEKMRPVEIKDD